VASSLMIVACGEPLSFTYFEMSSAVFARSSTGSQRRDPIGARLYCRYRFVNCQRAAFSAATSCASLPKPPAVRTAARKTILIQPCTANESLRTDTR
jgi:hypothetical protein